MNFNDMIFSDFRQGSLELFYQNVYPGLVMYARRYLMEDDKILAEDCVQDIVLDAWNRRKDFQDIYSLKAFLYRSLKNDILNILRKHTARSRYMGQLEDPVFYRNTVIDQEARTAIYNAIEELPENLRNVFKMNLFDGIKLADIAIQLQISERTVKKYKSDAIMMLRQKLDPYLFMTFLQFFI